MNAQQTADLKWLKKAEHWGEWERFDEQTGERESIWLLKSTSGPATRFYGKGRGQVGPSHDHMVAANYWAYGTGYLRTGGAAGMELACRAEVMAGGTVRPA